MSTTWRENYSFPRIFKDRRGRTGPGKGAELCQPWNPSSGQTDFRVIGCQEEKRTLPRTPADVSAFSYVAVENPHPGAGILTGFPFDGRRTRAHFQTELPCGNTFSMQPKNVLPSSLNAYRKRQFIARQAAG